VLRDHLGVPDLVFIRQIADGLPELLVLRQKIVNGHRPPVDPGPNECGGRNEDRAKAIQGEPHFLHQEHHPFPTLPSAVATMNRPCLRFHRPEETGFCIEKRPWNPKFRHSPLHRRTI